MKAEEGGNLYEKDNLACRRGNQRGCTNICICSRMVFGRHHTLRYRRYYFLQVEMYDPVTGAANTIQSQGYRKPVHRYLASDRVSVYTDRSGWKHYIEDFQWKEHRGDPDIFNMPKEFEEFHMGGEMLGKVIFVFIAVWILIQILVR